MSCGGEEMHIELRALTVCKLVCHQDYYLQPEVDASGLMNSNAVPAMSASYDQAVNENSDKAITLSCFSISAAFIYTIIFKLY